MAAIFVFLSPSEPAGIAHKQLHFDYNLSIPSQKHLKGEVGRGRTLSKTGSISPEIGSWQPSLFFNILIDISGTIEWLKTAIFA